MRPILQLVRRQRLEYLYKCRMFQFPTTNEEITIAELSLKSMSRHRTLDYQGLWARYDFYFGLKPICCRMAPAIGYGFLHVLQNNAEIAHNKPPRTWTDAYQLRCNSANSR